MGTLICSCKESTNTIQSPVWYISNICLLYFFQDSSVTRRLREDKGKGRHWRHINKLGHFRATYMKYVRSQYKTDWEIFSKQKVGRIRYNFFSWTKRSAMFSSQLNRTRRLSIENEVAGQLHVGFGADVLRCFVSVASQILNHTSALWIVWQTCTWLLNITGVLAFSYTCGIWEYVNEALWGDFITRHCNRRLNWDTSK